MLICVTKNVLSLMPSSFAVLDLVLLTNNVLRLMASSFAVPDFEL